MPLLRLLHQISNMYQNVKETQSELREQQPDNSKVAAKTTTNTSGILMYIFCGVCVWGDV